MTPEEIKANVQRLEQAQASPADIEAYVGLASKELSSGDSNTGIVGKTINTYKTAAKSFFPPFLEGASMGAFPADQPMAGSVFESPLQKTARGFGSFLGPMVPITASEMTGGAAGGIVAGGAKLGRIGTGLMRGLGTGMTYGAAESAMQHKSLPDAAMNVAGQGATFAGLGVAGGALGYIRELFGKGAVNELSNFFFKTDKGVAQKLANKGEESLGSQAMEYKGQKAGENVFTGFKGREQALATAKEELAMLRNRAGGIMEGADQEARTPYQPDPKPGGRLLDYKPGESQEVSPVNTPSYPEGAKTIETTQPGGVKYQTIVNPGVTVDFTGMTGPGSSPQSMEANIFKAKRSLRDIPNVPFQRNLAIHTADVASDLNPLIEKYGRVGKNTGPGNVIKKIQQDFIESNPEVMDMTDAVGVKSTLDRIVNDAYEKKAIDTTMRDQIYRELANGIRKRAYEISPDLGVNFDKQALMHDIITSLEPTQAKTGTLPYGGFWRNLMGTLTGNRVGLGTATVLKKTLGTPSKYIAPAVRKVGQRAAITPFDENQ